MNPLDIIDFYGLKVSDFNEKELENYINWVISHNENAVAYGYSLATIPLFKKFPALYHIINNFELMVTDGTQFYWFLKLMGFKIKTFLSIPDLTNFVLRIANEHKYSVMLLGADEKTNNRAFENLIKKYPGIIFYPGHHGYFNEEEEEKNIILLINQYKPDILLIGISTPKKENFISKYRSLLNTNLTILCGGMIDVFAGKSKQTPAIFKKLGLATLYRVIQEPRRLLLLNLWFIYEILFRIIPITFFEVKIKSNSKFFIPGIYGIKEKK